MKETLQAGIRYEHTFVVPQSKTVPALYPDIGIIQEVVDRAMRV